MALKKGHKDFVVIVSGLTAQREKHILAVLPDRKKETVKAFLKTLPPRQHRSIRQVCIDMNEGYCNAVLETLPEAQVVVDRFHVAKARKTEMKRLKKTLPEVRVCTIERGDVGFPKTLGSANRRTASDVIAAVSVCSDIERRVCATGNADRYF
nr:transposase [Methylotuvimicrobium alcaliphilum]